MNKCYFIGLHILLLINITQSYVLFTANIDDVRKLARKFVSESLAEKIANFIARVTQQTAGNVSKENEMNADIIDELSDREDKITRGIGRQRYDKTTDRKIHIRNPKNYEDHNNHAYEMVIDKRPNKDYDYEGKVTNKYEQPSKLRPKTVKKVEYEYHERIANKQEKAQERNAHKRSTAKRKNLVKQHKLATTKPKPKIIQKSSPKLKPKPKDRLYKKINSQITKQQLHTYDQKHKLSDDSKESRNVASTKIITSTLGYAEKFLNEDQPLYSAVAKETNSPKSLKQNRYVVASRNSHESPNNDSFIELNNKFDIQNFTIEEYNLKRASIDLTTRKERTEFDQYDNRNYPKAEFIATSGPVALPRLPTEKPWWERAMPDENTNITPGNELNS